MFHHSSIFLDPHTYLMRNYFSPSSYHLAATSSLVPSDQQIWAINAKFLSLSTSCLGRKCKKQPESVMDQQIWAINANFPSLSTFRPDRKCKKQMESVIPLRSRLNFWTVQGSNVITIWTPKDTSSVDKWKIDTGKRGLFENHIENKEMNHLLLDVVATSPEDMLPIASSLWRLINLNRQSLSHSFYPCCLPQWELSST